MPAMIPASDSLRIADSSLAVTTGLEVVSFEFRSALVATMVELVLMAMLLCSASVQEMTGAERAKPEEDESESDCSWGKREARKVHGSCRKHCEVRTIMGELNLGPDLAQP